MENQKFKGRGRKPGGKNTNNLSEINLRKIMKIESRDCDNKIKKRILYESARLLVVINQYFAMKDGSDARYCQLQFADSFEWESIIYAQQRIEFIATMKDKIFLFRVGADFRDFVYNFTVLTSEELPIDGREDTKFMNHFVLDFYNTFQKYYPDEK